MESGNVDMESDNVETESDNVKIESEKVKKDNGIRNFRRIVSSAKFQVFTAVFIERIFLGFHVFVVPAFLLKMLSSTDNMINNTFIEAVFNGICQENCPYFVCTFGPIIFYVCATFQYLLMLKAQLKIPRLLLTTLEKGVPKDRCLELISYWEKINFCYFLIEAILFISLYKSIGVLIGFIIITILRSVSHFLIRIYRRRFIQKPGKGVETGFNENSSQDTKSVDVLVISKKRLSLFEVKEMALKLEKMGLMKAIGGSNATYQFKKILSSSRASPVIGNFANHAKTVLRRVLIFLSLVIASLITYTFIYIHVVIMVKLALTNKEFTSLNEELSLKSVRPMVTLVSASITLLLLMWAQIWIVLRVWKASNNERVKNLGIELIRCWHVVSTLCLLIESQVFVSSAFLKFNMRILVTVTSLIALRVLFLVLGRCHRNQLCPIVRQVVITPSFKDMADNEKPCMDGNE